MSAMPDPSPKNMHRDLITRFKEEYATAILEAEVSAQHTSTEGWQRLYANQRKAERDERRRIAQDMRNVADRLESVGLDEDGEKEIGECKKASAALRDRAYAFETQTVNPVREPVDRCDKIINEARQAARVEEERTPLVNIGLEDLMKDAIAAVRRPRWDADLGRVVFSDPS